MSRPEPNFGKYHIRRELGRGAMGVVYEALDVALGSEAALKVVYETPNASVEVRARRKERFDREAAALAQLSHPRVVRLLDRGEVNGRSYFAMELVRGTTLQDRLQMQGPLSVSELMRLGIEMCHALDHVHLRGVVHRDVKPDNIMLLPDGGSKLMDFGVARLVLEQDTPASTGFQGSPAYMSPEQVAGHRVDGRSDLYSLAVTLYEAATGRRAVTGSSIPEILHKVATEYPQPPAGLPPSFQAILMRAMAKDPHQRYARGSEMADDLREGRMPAPVAGPVTAGNAYQPVPMPGYVPPAPTYLGYDPLLMPPVVPPAVPNPVDPTILAGWLEQIAPPPSVQAARQAACRMHPTLAGVADCASCGASMCYTCLLEVPGRGVICRTCGFAGPP